MSQTDKDALEQMTSMGILDGLINSINQHPQTTPQEIEIDKSLPVLPLRNNVLFPDIITPISVTRPRSLKLLDTLKTNATVVFLSQKDASVEDPKENDLYRVGTVGMILRVLKMPDNSSSVIVQGVQQITVETFEQEESFLVASIEPKQEPEILDVELDAYARTIKQLTSKVIELSPAYPNEASYAIQNIDNHPFLIHFISSNLNLPAPDKQKLLESSCLKTRAEKLIEYMNREVQVLELSKQIQTKVKTDIDQTQKEYLLRQQLKTIQNELGEGDIHSRDIHKLREELDNGNYPESVRSIVHKEIDKLSRLNQAAPDYSVTRNYVDTVMALPWQHYSETHINLHESETILNQDHYGLGKVKDRILEYLAVLKLKSNLKAPILCFCGPPGVGKTSLGRSIARALGRKFIRISLGGIRDEAEIRGHRRTYIGSMPGRIIQGLKQAGTSNPVFMLDEIDKIGHDFRGNPSSALLEVLDPSQNFSFSDHYLEIPYDLSKIMFIATANTLDSIPSPLRDRMEIIQLSGYSEYEKQHISYNYLIPRQLEEHGIERDLVQLEEKAVRKIISDYTREAGVRNLERQIANVCRIMAKDMVLKMEEHPNEKASPKPGFVVTEKYVKAQLGNELFFRDVSEPVELSGIAIGLAWTPTGGDILFFESTVMKGNGRLILTGQLGDVMKESAQAALSYLKSCADYFKIPDEAFRYWDVHVHIPQGSIPKDGPSAGVTILTSLASIYTQRKVKPKLAMTGEITLRGRILPVGGIKEKVLAAKRAGVKEILLPKRNKKDISEIKTTNVEILKNLSIKYFNEMDDLIDYALEEATESDETPISGESKPAEMKQA